MSKKDKQGEMDLIAIKTSRAARLMLAYVIQVSACGGMKESLAKALLRQLRYLIDAYEMEERRQKNVEGANG